MMSARLPLLPSWIRWGFVLTIGGYIFYVSFVTVPPTTVVDIAKPAILPLDKWRHFLAYAVFGSTVAYATADWHTALHYQILFIVGITLTYGVGIEMGQAFVQNRCASVADAYANAIGALLVLTWYALRPHIEFVPVSELLSEDPS
jgi:VanZ family protein